MTFVIVIVSRIYCSTILFSKVITVSVFLIQSELEDAQEKYRSIKVTLDNAYRLFF